MSLCGRRRGGGKVVRSLFETLRSLARETENKANKHSALRGVGLIHPLSSLNHLLFLRVFILRMV